MIMPQRSYNSMSGDTELSSQVREIISYQPAWVVRKGNLLFLLVLASLFLLTFFIGSPDTINAPAKILLASSFHKNEPVDSGHFYAQVTMPQAGLGKIKEGQKVILKLESYPSQEFGSVAGIISHIADTSGSNDNFLITVSLPQGLQTNYGKNIFYRTGLKAQAEIITDNRMLIDRLAGQLKSLWNK